MAGATPVRHLWARRLDSAAGHTRGSHQGSGTGQAGVHREARHLVGRPGCASVRPYLRNGFDVRPRRTRASATPETIDSSAAWQGARELQADHRGQYASCACHLADRWAVQDVACGARTHPRRDSPRHVRCREPRRARPARRPLRAAARPRFVTTTHSARRPSLAGRVEALAQARPRQPGNRRAGDADDRVPGVKTPICPTAPTSCRYCSQPAARTAST